MTLWARVFAAIYDPVTARWERGGLAAARRELLAGARGRVLEIGAGTGRNVEHYPAGVDITYTEPDVFMAKRLRGRAKNVVVATVDELPFPDDSFDTVVSTLVLCTVPSVTSALAQIRRVLVPDGRLLFLEHVRAERGTPLERWQNRLHRPWRAFAGGCNCNRDLLDALDAAGFELADVRRSEERFMPPLIRPLARGTASC
jgi:SAM-dependent methyltransferase